MTRASKRLLFCLTSQAQISFNNNKYKQFVVLSSFVCVSPHNSQPSTFLFHIFFLLRFVSFFFLDIKLSTNRIGMVCVCLHPKQYLMWIVGGSVQSVKVKYFVHFGFVVMLMVFYCYGFSSLSLSRSLPLVIWIFVLFLVSSQSFRCIPVSISHHQWKRASQY